MSNTTTPATSDEALRAENEALKAQLAQIESIVSDFRGGTTYDKVATMIQTTTAARACRAATKEAPAEVPLPPCDMGELCIGCQPRCSPPVAEDTPLETSEADARELPPEVVAKFMTPQ